MHGDASPHHVGRVDCDHIPFIGNRHPQWGQSSSRLIFCLSCMPTGVPSAPETRFQHRYNLLVDATPLHIQDELIRTQWFNHSSVVFFRWQVPRCWERKWDAHNLYDYELGSSHEIR